MAPKDDPLGQQQRHGPRVLWLGRENMEEARDNYWRAFEQYWRATAPVMLSPDKIPAREQWNVAWAAAIAAFSYIMEGRVGPREDPSQ